MLTQKAEAAVDLYVNEAGNGAEAFGSDQKALTLLWAIFIERFVGRRSGSFINFRCNVLHKIPKCDHVKKDRSPLRIERGGARHSCTRGSGNREIQAEPNS